MEERNKNNEKAITTSPSSDEPDQGINNDSDHSPDDPNSSPTTANSPPSILLLDVRQQVTVDALGHRGVYTGQIHVNGDRPNDRGLPSGQGEMIYQHGGRMADEKNDEQHASGTAAAAAAAAAAGSTVNDNDDDLPASYKGAFVDGYWHGQGRQELRNGDVFVGEFQKSRRVFGEYRWNAQATPATQTGTTTTTTRVIKKRMYQGAFQNDRPHGHGKYTWKTITTTLSDDNVNGKDENNDTITSTSSYVGMFEYGQRQGHGIYSSPVLEYTGDWMQGKYQGYGTLVYKTADGSTMSTYRGNFANGKREGKGTLVLNDGIVVHDGLWKEDRPSSTKKEEQGEAQNGRESRMLDKAPPLSPDSSSKAKTSFTSSLWGGIEALASSFSAPVSEDTNTTPQASVKLTKSTPTASSSSTYNKDCKAVVDIDVVDGQDNRGRYTGIIHIESQRPHGVGRMVYSDGNRVSEGFWVNGSREGHGRCLFVKTGDYYEGEFQDNLRHGKGRYVWKDGRRFEGTYMMDERHGEGVFSYPNGDCFTGSFDQGTRAFGVFQSKHSTYRGEWKNNTYHGKGELRWEEGHAKHEYKGSFKEGHFDGEGKETVDGKVMQQGQWKKGKFVQASETPAAPTSVDHDKEVSQDDSNAEAIKRVPST